MKKPLWAAEQLEEISRIQEQRNLTRKGALQYFRRQQKAQPAAQDSVSVPGIGIVPLYRRTSRRARERAWKGKGLRESYVSVTT